VPGSTLAAPKMTAKRDEFVLVVAGLAACAILFFWIVVSKMLPPTGNALIEAMRVDEYYCILVPLTLLPVSLLANHLRWFSNALFQHNEW